MSGLVEVLQGIELEPKALREGKSDLKALMSRDDSFAKLKLRGYERHLYAREYFALLIASCEGKLPPDKQLAINDMNKDTGEWFHDVVFTDGEKITFYEGVPKIADEPSQLKYTAKKTFKLNRLKQERYYSVIQVFDANPELGKHIWTIQYDELPESIKTKSGLILPEKNTVTPVGNGCYSCNIVAHYHHRASRGVIVSKKSLKEITLQDSPVKEYGEYIIYKGEKYIKMQNSKKQKQHEK